MAWRTFLLGLAGLAASALLIYFAKPIAIFLLSGFGVEPETKRPPVAEVITTSGRSFVRASGQGSFSRLNADVALFQKDEIKTEKNSRIHLRFDSGYEIEILEESQAILDIWSERSKRRPEYISFLRGDFRVLQNGTPGRLYIVLDNDVFAPEARPERVPKAFKISTSGVTPIQPQKTNLEALPEDVSAQTKEPQSTSNLTLSSAYIESVFFNRSALFRRCQLTSLRDNKMGVGNMLFSLMIKPNGKVHQVKLLQKSFENPSLENCVISVIERTKFKSFQGAEISLSYPLNFQ